MYHFMRRLEISVILSLFLRFGNFCHASGVFLIDTSTPGITRDSSTCPGRVLVFEIKLHGQIIKSGCVLEGNISSTHTNDPDFLEPFLSFATPAGSEFCISSFDPSQRSVTARVLIQPVEGFPLITRNLWELNAEEQASHGKVNSFTVSGSFIISLAISDRRLQWTRFFAISIEVVAGYADPSESMILYMDTAQGHSLVLPRYNETVQAGILEANSEIARYFPHCFFRNCLILQCWRFDAFGNRVVGSATTDIISLDVMGVKRASDRLDSIHNLSYTPGELIETFETYQEGSVRVPIRGNTSCSDFQCPLSNIALPNTKFQTWIMVYLNGVPVGKGNPAFMIVRTGELFNYYIDDASLRGNVVPGAVEPVLYPVDAGGNRILDIWDAEKCQDECMMLASENASLVRVFSSCYLDELSNISIVITSANNRTQPMQFKFRAERTCSNKDSCTRFQSEWSNLKCSQCSEEPNVFQQCGKCHELVSKLKSCSYSCGWFLVASFDTKKSGICVLNVTFKGKPLISALKTFRGAVLPRGNVILTIFPSSPSPIYSTLHEWNISLLSSPIHRLITTADENTSIQVALILRDQFGNLITVPEGVQGEVVRVMLHSVFNVIELSSLAFSSSFRAVKIQGPATISGSYLLQVYFLPSLEVLASPPLDIVVQPSLPLAKNTVLLTKPLKVIANAFNTFYLQVRDRFGNNVLSSDAFFQPATYGKRAAGFAPGFRIWAVKTNDVLLGYQALHSQSSLKNSFRGCPLDCGGLDPGVGSLQGAFQPRDIGDYNVKVQFCDPIVYPGGAACLDAYDLMLLEPPMAPNPCNDLPTGTPGPRHGLACDIIGIEFTTYAGPDRITKAMIRWDQFTLGEPCHVSVLPMDRNDRNAGLANTTCRYSIEFSSMLTGNCTYVPSMWAFEFYFTPLISGTYSINVFINEVATNDSPSSKTVLSSIKDFNSTMSTAVGDGVKEARVGWSNSFDINLRDHFGNLIPRHYVQSIVGNPYPEDCGYAFPTLSDGTRTIGYGLTGAQSYGPSSGCRFSFQMYLVNVDGRILRPVRGFTVLSIVPLPSGNVQIRYSVEEPGLHDFYVRYLPNSNAGFILHDSKGYLSLNAQNFSREGQIHGSPFRVFVHPYHADANNTRVIGVDNGHLTTLSTLAWTGFDIRTRDQFYNLVVCNFEEVNVVILNPHQRVVNLNVTSGTTVMWECRVDFQATVSGKYKITIKIREKEIPGSPFSPMILAKDSDISLQNSFARLITTNAILPCYEQSNLTSTYYCIPEVRAGQLFYVRVSPRGVYNNTPDDGSVYFQALVVDNYQNETFVYRSTRIRAGEHKISIVLTVSGQYSLSVLLKGTPLRFAPHLERHPSIQVKSAESIDASACQLNGYGLSVATAGSYASFQIFPKDKFGNSYLLHPSSGSDIDGVSGQGTFQVILKGAGNSTILGAVSMKVPSAFQVSYLVTTSGQYFVFITIFENAPSQLPSSPLAVSKLGIFSDFDLNIVSSRRGHALLNDIQPFKVDVKPNTFCINPSPSKSCNGSSFWQLINARYDRIIAEEQFIAVVSFRDQCGNPSPSFGSQIAVRFDSTRHSVNFSANAFDETDLHLSFSISLSGMYQLKVLVNQQELHSGVSPLFILPLSVTNASTSTVAGLPGSFPISGDSFTFNILARDKYGNSRTNGWDSFQISMIPFDQPNSWTGQSRYEVNVNDLMDGKYNVKVHEIKSRGLHFLHVYYSGDHLQNSPYVIEISRSNIFPDHTFAFMSEHVEAFSPQEFANQTNFFIYAGGRALLRLAGKDEAGLSTRLGLEELDIFLEHAELGIMRLSREDSKKYRTQTLCVDTIFGQTCEEPKTTLVRPVRPKFFFEIMQDGVDFLSSSFEIIPNASCRSLSGSDAGNVIFSNTFQKFFEIVIPSVVFNSTSNTTYISNTTSILVEQHPTSIYSMNECKMKCLEYYCSCATFIQGTNSYKDGTCIIFQNATFLQHTSKYISLLGYTAILPESIMIQKWYEQKPYGDIEIMLSCDVPGNALLFVQVSGINIGNSPYIVKIVAGLFDILSSRIWIADLSGTELPMSYKSLDNKTIQVFRVKVAENYTLYLEPKDSYGNSIYFDFWSSQIPVELHLASIRGLNLDTHNLSLVMRWMSDSVLTTQTTIFKSGMYSISILWKTLLPSETFLDIIPNSPCSILGPNQTQCSVPCKVQIPIAPDCYGNVILNSPALNCYVFEKEIEAFITANLGSVVFAFADRASSFNLFLTRAGRYQCAISMEDSVAYRVGQIEVLPSLAVRNLSMFKLKGIGLNTAVLHSNFTNQFSIMTIDSYGNAAMCLSSYFRAQVSIRNLMPSPLMPLTYSSCGAGSCAPVLITNGTLDYMQCIVQYWPAINISHLLEVEFLNQSIFSQGIQIRSEIGNPSNVSVECDLVTFDLWREGIRLPCDVEEQIPSGCQLRLRFAASDQYGFPVSVIKDPILEIQVCSPMEVLGGYCNGTNLKSSTQFNKSRVGWYHTNVSITVAGQYWVRIFYQLEDLEISSIQYVFNISAGATDLKRINLRGQGLNVAFLDYPNSFQFDDQDSFGNPRIPYWSISSPKRCTFSAHIIQSENIIPAKLEDFYTISGFSPGVYIMTYRVSSAEHVSSCISYLDSIILQVQYCDSTIFTNQLAVRCITTFIPGFAYVDPSVRSQDQVIMAGRGFSFNVTPQDQLGFDISPSFERLFLTSDMSALTFSVRQEPSTFVVDVQFTLSGSATIYVLDGLVGVKASPFHVKVIADSPVPETCRIYSPKLQSSFVQETIHLQGTVNDRFGNLISSSFPIISIFLKHTKGFEDIQADGDSRGLYEMFSYETHFSGEYIMTVYVQEKSAVGGILDNGIFQNVILASGNSVKVITFQTDPQKSIASGHGLTTSTAGLLTTFSIFARDSFAFPRTLGNDVFYAHLIGPVNVSCSITNKMRIETSNTTELSKPNISEISRFTTDEYLVTYYATVSGLYYLTLMVTGIHLPGSPFITIIRVGDISASHSQLLQDIPTVRYYAVVNLVPVSATSSLADGSFLRTVGKNSFLLALSDKFGNQVENVDFNSCCDNQRSVNITAFITPQLVEVSGNSFSMSDVGNYVESINSNKSANSTNSSNLKNYSNSQMSRFEAKKIALDIVYIGDGLFSIEYICTAAGKYRLHVFIDGNRIGRHIPIEEMQSSGENLTTSFPDCCVPLVDLCPAAKISTKVCGDLITFVPTRMNVANSAISGSSTKEFRYYVDGDGEGNRQYPVFNIEARDEYGNTLTSALTEFLVSIIHMNGTTIVKQPAVSVQPINPQLVCRTSTLDSLCGKFQYAWTSASASKSGLYKVQVTYNGIQIGQNSSFITIRSREADSKTAQIFGPGIHVNSFNARTYFFFRVFDILLNPWEPDCCLPNKPGPINIDFGTPTSFGLNRGQRLFLNTTPADNRTRLIYLGFGLFKVEYAAVGPIGPGSGSIQFFYGQSILAKTRPLKGFIPATIDGGYAENAPVPLYPVAKLSFATGSALYDHCAGDTVDLYIHALSGLNTDPTVREGWWPALADYPGKYFVVEVQGPAGTKPLRFIPQRDIGEFPWRFHLSWTLTVSGEYNIFVEYDSLPVQGDSSTDYINMPISPWVIQVHPAPVAPAKTILVGQGISFATIGEMTSFLIITKDIFGNQINSDKFFEFKERENVNGTILGAWGSSIPLNIQSQGDGSYYAFYVATQAGSYALTLMIDGISVRVPPKLIYVFPGKPSTTTTRWQVSSSEMDQQRCLLFPAYGDFCSSPRPAGSAIFVDVEVRDAVNNSITVTSEEATIRAEIDGGDFNGLENMLYSGGALWSMSFVLTATGSYHLWVFLDNTNILGSPITITVVASALFAPNCFLGGDGIFYSTVNHESSVFIHGRDMFGNDQSMEDAALYASFQPMEGISVETRMITVYAYVASLKYTPSFPGEHTMSVAIIDITGNKQLVRGSGSIVTVSLQKAPIMLRASFLNSGAAILVEYDQLTDMGCVYGMTHSLCVESAVSHVGDCSFFLEDVSIQKLGGKKTRAQYSESPNTTRFLFHFRCEWRSPQELLITLGFDPQINVGDFLRFLPKIRNANGSSEYIVGSIPIDLPRKIVIPNIALIMYKDRLQCNMTKIYPELFIGGLSRSVRYFWGVDARSEPCKSNYSCLNFFESDHLTFIYDTFASARFGNIWLYAYNFMGGHAVMNSRGNQSQFDGKIFVEIDKGNDFVASRADVIKITARVGKGECNIGVQNVGFAWRMSLLAPGGTVQAVSSAPTFRIEPFTLTAGVRYHWTLLVTYEVNMATFSREINGFFNVSHSPLRALIFGGNSTIPSQFSSILLDASMSIDPDISPFPSIFSWKCHPVLKLKQTLQETTEVSPLPCFYDMKRIMVGNSSILNLTGMLSGGLTYCHSCLPGIYSITVNFTKQPGDRWSISTTIIKVLNESLLFPVAGVLPFAKLVNTQSRLKLDGIETSGVDVPSLAYQWTILVGHGLCCSGFLNMSDVSLFPSGISSRYLIIKPFSLLPGFQYILRFTVQHILSGAYSFADLYITVEESPHSGMVTVFPSSGISATTKFGITCEYWSATEEDIPFQYEYRYLIANESNLSDEISLDQSFNPRLSWILPACPTPQLGFFVVYISNAQGSTVRASVPVKLFSSLFLAQSTLIQINSTLTVDIEQAVGVSRYDLAFQYFDIAVSLFNLRQSWSVSSTDHVVERRSVNSLSEMILETRIRIFRIAFSLFQRTDLTEAIMISRMLVSIRYLTALPSEFPAYYLESTISTTLRLVDALIHLQQENIQMVKVASQILANIMDACSALVEVEPTQPNLALASSIMQKVPAVFQLISELSINFRAPGDEHVIVWTKAFAMNTVRISPFNLAKQEFSVASLLPSQQTEYHIQYHAIYKFPIDLVNLTTNEIRVKAGEFEYGLHPYPGTVYDIIEKFPLSRDTGKQTAMVSKYFGPVPLSQLQVLKTAFIDVQILEWEKNPFLIQERNLTQINEADYSYGQLIWFACSSALIECAGRDHMCIPPSIDGNRAPNYRDLSCFNAFDADSDTTWAVNPSKIDKIDGTGSNISLIFGQEFTWSILKYRQRKGPRYCRGSSGIACFQSSQNCTCIPGGDRLLAVQFQDGSTQYVELVNTYEMQEFNLRPVRSKSIVITVISVYSNSRSCPRRSACSWWEPTCADWCPNGAASIEFLSTFPSVQVYNHNFSYRSNYSLAAALVSRVTSVNFRQMEDYLPFHELVTAIEVAIREVDTYSFSLGGNFSIVCCKKFNTKIGRWSSQGVLNSGRKEYFDNSTLPWHICLTFEPASLSLILVENPTAFVTLHQSAPLILDLANYIPNSLCPFFVVFCHILLFVFLTIKYISQEAENWKQREISAMTRERQVFNENGIKLHVSDPPSYKPPSHRHVYFPIPILEHSKILGGLRQKKESVFAVRVCRSFGQWHYLYTCFWNGAADIGFVHRSLSFISLTLVAFTINCTFLSHIDMTTAYWYSSLLKTSLILSPLAQIFPVIFRTVTMNKLNVYSSSQNSQTSNLSPKDMTNLLSSSLALGKSRLKHLKLILGEDVITTIKENSELEIPDSIVELERSNTTMNLSLEESESETQKSHLQKASLTPNVDDIPQGIAESKIHAVPYMHKIESPNDNTGTLQYFLKHKKLEMPSTNPKTVQLGQDSILLTAESKVSLDPEGATKATPLGFLDSLPGSALSTTESVEDIKKTIVVAAGRKFGSLGANFKSNQFQIPKGSHSDWNMIGELIPPPPPPRISEPPPRPPPGKPPVKLGKAAERTFWRSLRIHELVQEAPFFESQLRRTVLSILITMGDSDWNLATRQRAPSLLPRTYLFLAYIFWVLWVITCFVVISMYSVHYDSEIGSMWILASMLSLSIELLFMQTVLSASFAWWTSSLGKPMLIHVLHHWALERADLLPAYG